MDAEAMNELKRRAEAATPGPWYAHNIDDDLFMNLYAVTTSEAEPEYEDIVIQCGDRDRADGHVVAVTLLQSPRLGNVQDMRFEENTRYIAAACPTATLSLIAHAEHQQAAIVEAQRWLAEGMDSGTPLAGIAEALRVLAQVDQS